MGRPGCWRAYIGLGANLPWGKQPPRATLEQAVAELGGLGVIEARSRWWRTTPSGPVADQPEFLNGAVQLRTLLSPQMLLLALLVVEQRFGRVRDPELRAKGPRTLDLDLLLAEELEEGRAGQLSQKAGAHWRPVVENTQQLILPHPELHHRKFALAPLNELAPGLIHPLLRQPIGALLEALADSSDQALPESDSLT